jgi:hypothetical protein
MTEPDLPPAAPDPAAAESASPAAESAPPAAESASPAAESASPAAESASPAAESAPPAAEPTPPEPPSAAETALTGTVATQVTGDAWALATDDVGARAAAPAGAAAAAPAPAAAARAAGRAAPSPSPSPPPSPRAPAPRRPDPVADLQRWLIKSGARGVRREVEDQIRRALGGARRAPEDVWGRATTEPPPHEGESPECQWCPICRAARAARESGPGLGPQLTGVSGALSSAVQDALTAVDGIISRSATASGPRRPADRARDVGPAGSASPAPDPAAPEPAARDQAEPAAAERAVDEPGDRG